MPYRFIHGGVRSMWVIAMFDLPTETKENRSEYRKFREALLHDGFMMLQYSVYGRPCPNLENALVHQNRVKDWVPTEGEVRVTILTNVQFARTAIFYGKAPKPPEPPAQQLSFW